MALAAAITGHETPERTQVDRGAAHSYRPDIDGLRAIAILSVVFNHAGLPWLTGGFSGVDIFFVVSGYLIGGQIHSELSGAVPLAGVFSFLHFYQRRAKRILPALFAVLAFSVAASMALLSPGDAADLARSALASTLSVSNVLFWGTTNYFAGKSGINPLLMTWSLGVEEQFYAVIPLLMVWLSRLRRIWMQPAIIALSATSFVFAWAILANHPMIAFYLLPARAWELGAGVSLAVWQANRNRHAMPPAWTHVCGTAGMALMLAPMFLLHPDSPFPGAAALPTVAGAMLALASGTSWINRRLLTLPPLVFIGKISYSFYLWHWPLLALARIVYGGEAPATIRISAIGLSFVCAVLSYLFIEQPFRGSRRNPVPLLIRYAAASCAIGALCAAIWLSRGVPRRFPSLAARESAQLALRSDPCLAGYGKDAPNPSPACIESSATQPLVAIWGDSHAAALAPGLRTVASAQGYGLVQFTKAACPPLIAATHYSPRIPMLAAECMRFNAHVAEQLRSDPQIRIVLLNADWGGLLYRDWQDGWLAADLARAKQTPSQETSRKLFIDSLAQTIRMLDANGKTVMVMSDVPTFEIDPIWRVETTAIPARRALARWLQIPNTADSGLAATAGDAHATLADELLNQAVSATPAAKRIDLKQKFCTAPNLCAYHAEDKLLYIDSNHLSADGAMFAAHDLKLPPAPNTSP